MIQFQVQVPLGTLPVNLVLVGNRMKAGVVFVKVAEFGCVFDADAAGNISAAFYEDEFHIFSSEGGEEVFQYATVYDYKQIPAMLEWLQQQHLQEPQNVIFG